MWMRKMAFYKNIFIETGIIAVVYIALKLFMNVSEKELEKDSDTGESDELVNQQTDENTVDSAEPKPKSVKRKLDDNKGDMKFPRPKPNFFIAFPVNDVGIHYKVKKLQENLIMKNPSLFPALVNVSTLHVTLAVTHLANEKDINTVKVKLDEWAEKNLEKYFEKQCILTFRGVSTFNNQVAYVDIEQGENYKKIFDISKNVNDILSSSGFTIEKRSFKPHLTFVKLSKSFKLLKLKRSFKEDFESLKDCREHFGNQEVSHIQLLSMDEPKDEFGYYKCYYQIKVSDTNLNLDHSECCSPIAKP